MSEIQALTLRTEALSRAVDFWNLLMIWGLALAFLAAGFVLVTTRIIVTRTGQLTDAQTLLERTKDRQLQTDLKQKDIEISRLNKVTEEERIERLNLEKQIAPRRLTLEQQEKITSNCVLFSALFKGKRVKVVSYALDVEGLVLAEQITATLRASGMTVDDDAMSITPTGTFVFGIDVFGADTELAKKIAYAIGSSGRPVAVSFTEKDPIADASRIEYGAPKPDATILVGVKMIDENTIDAIKRANARHR